MYSVNPKHTYSFRDRHRLSKPTTVSSTLPPTQMTTFKQMCPLYVSLGGSKVTRIFVTFGLYSRKDPEIHGVATKLVIST